MEVIIKQDTIYFEGILTLKQIDSKLIDKKISRSKDDIKQFDLTKVTLLDTAGAYIIIKTAKNLSLSKENIIFANEKDKNLVDIVFKNFPSTAEEELSSKSNVVFNSIYTLGKNTNNLLSEIKTSISFLGAIF